jgi:phosphotransferase system HPr-like phosphotransfer protein
MYKAVVKFDTVMDAKTFVEISARAPFKIGLVCDRYEIDAKSLMGLFCLDLSKPIELQAECDDFHEYVTQIANYVVS